MAHTSIPGGEIVLTVCEGRGFAEENDESIRVLIAWMKSTSARRSTMAVPPGRFWDVSDAIKFSVD
jgi:hypothetical protein